jgi:hypothetical protein
MDINRRNFLKVTTGSALTTIGAAQAFQREPKTMPPKAVGILCQALCGYFC